MPSTSNPYMTLRPYKDMWERLKLAWNIARYGKAIPMPPIWYDSMCAIVGGEYSACVEKAVLKNLADPSVMRMPSHERVHEARQWARIYWIEAKKGGEPQEWVTNFLIEYWVGRFKSRLS